MRMADFVKAEQESRAARRWWIVTEANVHVRADYAEPVALLVSALCAAQACALAAATCWDNDNGLQSPAKWCAHYVNGDLPDAPKRMIGVWAAPEYVWAALGYEPSDDWQRCHLCGEVKYIDGWSLEGDDCDECERDNDSEAT